MTDLLLILKNDALVFYVFLAILGLIMGSFFNMIIYRLPLHLKKIWTKHCKEFLPAQATVCYRQPKLKKTPANIELSESRSRCPKCLNIIKIQHNIPLFSYLFLKGRCASCSQYISFRYPLVELSTAVLSVFVGYQFGFTDLCIWALIYTWVLIVLSFIDIDHQLLPDCLTLSLLWLGLILSINTSFIDTQTAILGAVLGYLVLWVFVKLFYLLTHKQGMGEGDFKLLAAMGAWLGPHLLPLIIIGASLTGAVIGLIQLRISRRDTSTPIPFGPHLSLWGFISLIWGDDIINWYLQYAGFNNPF